ncbi:DUF6776 family protein [Luteimonas sp. e5]
MESTPPDDTPSPEGEAIEPTQAATPAAHATPRPAMRAREPWLPWAVALIAILIALASWFSARQAASTATTTQADAALQQEIANLRQSDRISRQAMLELQDSLAERDEQIIALRADLDFYERFVSPQVQRRGLSVHDAVVAPEAANVWRFELTLTQAREQAGGSSGTLELAVEGSRDGQLVQLDWAELRQQAEAPGIDYSLRYLQRVEGQFALPEGFVPTRLLVRLKPARGNALEHAFNWKDIVRA